MDSPDILAGFSGVVPQYARVLRALLPHAWLEDGVYVAVAATALSVSEIADQIRDACLRIETLLGGSIATSEETALRDALRRMEPEPLFRPFLAASVRHLYDDVRVWSGCGYEGVAGCNGAAQRDGIDDAVWLPDPLAEGAE